MDVVESPLQATAEHQQRGTQEQGVDLDNGGHDAFGCAGSEERCKSRNGDHSAAYSSWRGGNWASHKLCHVLVVRGAEAAHLTMRAVRGALCAHLTMRKKEPSS